MAHTGFYEYFNGTKPWTSQHCVKMLAYADHANPNPHSDIWPEDE